LRLRYVGHTLTPDGRITADPSIRLGKACIAGTRLTVGDILGFFSAEMTLEEILEDYPELNREDIQAALTFAAKRES